MRSPQRVVWSEGLFMMPQHFQQQDLYHEAFVAARVGALAPYDWGVVELSVDTEALSTGVLQLHRFCGVLPDGTPLAFERGQEEAPPARAVDEAVADTQRSVEVFLGLPKERAADGAGAASSARFVPVDRPVVDLHAVNSVADVRFGRGNVRLLLGAELRDDLVSIKVAELERAPAGGWVLSEGYIPPCLRISASPAIQGGLRKLLRVMVGKQRELAEARRQRDSTTMEFGASDVTRYLQLSALNSIIPVVNHLVEAGDQSPLATYLLLVQAVGQLFTFSAEGDPSTLPRFQYTNLRATFDGLFTRAQELLRGLAHEQCISVALEQRQPGLRVAKLGDERVARCTQFVLAVRSQLPEQQVAEQFPRLVKMASTREIGGIVQAATPGVPLVVTYRPPPEVPVRPGTVYFTVSTQDGYWRTAVRDGELALYLPQALDPVRTQVELLAVPGAAGT